MKKIIIGSLLVVGLSAGYAFAYGNGHKYMRGGGSQMMGQGRGNCSMMCGEGVRYGHQGKGNYSKMRGEGVQYGQGRGNYSKMRGEGIQYGCQGPRWLGENDSVSNEERQQFLDATVELRKQMSAKRFELREAARNQNATPSQLAEIEKEMIDIRAKIQEQALKFEKSAN